MILKIQKLALLELWRFSTKFLNLNNYSKATEPYNEPVSVPTVSEITLTKGPELAPYTEDIRINGDINDDEYSSSDIEDDLFINKLLKTLN